MTDQDEAQPAPLTRSGVARRLGLSLSGVRKLEITQKLHPRMRLGVHVFDRAEVEALALERGAIPTGDPMATERQRRRLAAQREEAESAKYYRDLLARQRAELAAFNADWDAEIEERRKRAASRA